MQLPIRVSQESAEPMYHQIETQLRALILSGQLAEGTLLPSIREFAQGVSCSVITIRRVYQDLENEGLLRTRQGTGTFVAKVDIEDQSKFRNQAVYEALKDAVSRGKAVNCGSGLLRELFEKALIEVYGEGKR
ncbi:GntR family transcriptional regulator [Paenibacillus thermotolerans]|uniref:GntR family transcriptional regulator n=1 Tax=Paenibacillus thermotolerans TaxID=3027807 RepID=UPI0023682C03|nr:MULTISPECIES: GntR family transcriptional regulator [unclassified Paenibacillus]